MLESQLDSNALGDDNIKAQTSPVAALEYLMTAQAVIEPEGMGGIHNGTTDDRRGIQEGLAEIFGKRASEKREEARTGSVCQTQQSSSP